MTKNKTDELDSTNVQESADLTRIQANKLLVAIAIEAAKLAERSITLENLVAKLIDIQWKTDSPELRAEIVAACDAGESAMEELLIELKGDKWGSEEMFREDKLQDQLGVTEVLSEVLSNITQNSKKQNKTTTDPYGRTISDIKLTDTKLIDTDIKLLKNKLIGMWLSAPEETDSTELRTEIYAACDAGERAMWELLIKLMEMQQTAGSGEESINDGHARIDFDEQGTEIRSDLPIPTPTPTLS